MTIRRVLLPLNVAILLSISHHVQAGSTFQDGEFAPGNWTASILQSTTVVGTPSVVGDQVLTGGFPSSYRSNLFSFSYNGSGFSQGIIVGNLANTFTYNPAVSGALSSISYSLNTTNTSETTGGPPIFTGLLLAQGGSYYYPNNLLFVANNTWNTPSSKVSALAPTDFAKFAGSGPSVPDFSTNGAPMQFGYVLVAALSSGGATNITVNIGTDNFELFLANNPRPVFTSEQVVGTNALFTLSGLAPGENVTWYFSTNLVDWATSSNYPATTAAGTTAAFSFTNGTPASASFVRALVQ